MPAGRLQPKARIDAPDRQKNALFNDDRLLPGRDLALDMVKRPLHMLKELQHLGREDLVDR